MLLDRPEHAFDAGMLRIILHLTICRYQTEMLDKNLVMLKVTFEETPAYFHRLPC